MSKLRDAVEKWVRAEWYFRWSAHNYTEESQTAFYEAENELREALTGEQDLRKAGETLGLKMNKKSLLSFERKVASAPVKKKARVRATLDKKKAKKSRNKLQDLLGT